MAREPARHRQEWVAKRQGRYQEIDTGLKRHVGLRRYAPNWSKIRTRLLKGTHFWIALPVMLATLLLIVIAPLRIRRSAPHRFAPFGQDTHRHKHLTPSQASRDGFGVIDGDTPDTDGDTPDTPVHLSLRWANCGCSHCTDDD